MFFMHFHACSNLCVVFAVMSGVTSHSETYYASFIDNSDRFLENHIHRLTRVVRPQQFYTWLRKHGVLTQDDQEEVESKYYTTTMKAGIRSRLKLFALVKFIVLLYIVQLSIDERRTAVKCVNIEKSDAQQSENTEICLC